MIQNRCILFWEIMKRSRTRAQERRTAERTQNPVRTAVPAPRPNPDSVENDKIKRSKQGKPIDAREARCEVFNEAGYNENSSHIMYKQIFLCIFFIIFGVSIGNGMAAQAVGYWSHEISDWSVQGDTHGPVAMESKNIIEIKDDGFDYKNDDEAKRKNVVKVLGRPAGKLSQSEQLKSLLVPIVGKNIHIPKPIEKSPHELYCLILGELDALHKEEYHTDDFSVWGDMTAIDWADASTLIGKGPNWAYGMWHLDYVYKRSDMIGWVQSQIFKNSKDKNRLGKVFEAAAMLSCSYDPLLASEFNSAAMRLLDGDRWINAAMRQLWCWKRVGEDEKINHFLKDPISFQLINTDSYGMEKMLLSQEISRLEDKETTLLYIAAGRDVRNDRSSLIAKGENKQKLINSLRSGVQVRFSKDDKEKVSKLQIDGREFLAEMSIPVESRFMGMTEVELKKAYNVRSKIFGSFSHVVADLMLYMVEQRDCDGYLDRAQEMLYTCIHVHRTYGKVRSFPLYIWVQESGLQSPLTGRAMYHERFNAMEVPLYLMHVMNEDILRNCEGIQDSMRGVVARSIGLAFDPVSKQMFRPTWDHRWMTLFAEYAINSSFNNREESVPWLEFQMHPKVKAPDNIRYRARYQLADYNWHFGDRDVAAKMYMDIIHDENDASPKCIIFDDLVKLAIEKNDQVLLNNLSRKLEDLIADPAFDRSGSQYFVDIIKKCDDHLLVGTVDRYK
ncbi:MAG: hypothetical protein HRU15_10095 [Planctomycetes bacterium]|nr:hypothetical protein [Planctomycetota bacterium]